MHDSFYRKYCWSCVHSIYRPRINPFSVVCENTKFLLSCIDGHHDENLSGLAYEQAQGEALVDKIIKFRFGGGQSA